MENKDFYITLPSNSSLNYFEDNTLSSYKTLLPRHFSLNPQFEWEIGLAEIQFPTNLQPILANDELFVGVKKAENDSGIYTPPDWIRNNQIIKEYPTKPEPSLLVNPSDLKWGSYRLDISSKITETYEFLALLMSKLNKCEIIEEYKKQKTLSESAFNISQIEKRGGKFQLKITLSPLYKGLSLILPASIGRILGFPLNNDQCLSFRNAGDYNYPNQTVDLTANRPPFFFVYCNLVEYSIVGEYLVPNLRSVLLPKNDVKRSFISTAYSPVSYYPLAVKSFNIIEIELRSQTGEKIPFSYGVVNVILHCRKKTI